MTQRLTTLGYAILGLLCQERLSGYRIRKIFETTPLGSYSSSPGTIYPALRRLKKSGLIEQVSVQSEKGTMKKVFQLTDTGSSELRVWLRKPVTPEEVRVCPEVLMLRFSFMDYLDELEVKLRFLRAFRDESIAFVQEITAYREAEKDNMPINGLLALDSGIEGYKAQAKWADYAIKLLRQKHGS